jgi:RNA 3'-phosphate cyclase
MGDMLIIDGARQEGGGQILRTSLALSTLTGTPFAIINIRRHRPTPGLKPQHLKCVETLRHLTGARIEGARPGSQNLRFEPGRVRPQKMRVDIGTAGSIPLLLQAVLLPAAFSGRKVVLTITGGTDTRWSMSSDYLLYVILPHFAPYADVAVRILRRGFYPRGQGEVEMTIRPKHSLSFASGPAAALQRLRETAPELRLEKPAETVQVRGVSAAALALQKADVSKRQSQGATDAIGGRFPVDIREEYAASASNGTVITLWAVGRNNRVSVGADALGQKGVRAETVGQAAARRLLAALDSGAVADQHLADNLMPLLALAGGVIRTERITRHILANIYVCETFLKEGFTVDEHANRVAVRRR